MTTIHTLVFADREAAAWGAFWLPGQEGSAPLACQLDGNASVVTAALEATGDAGAWQLEGDGVSLVFGPSGPAANSSSTASGIVSLDQLCNVSGTLVLGGSRHEIDCLGWRARLGDGLDLAKIDTFRQTYGWFDPTDGVALAALRPRGAAGHDTDLVAAALVEPEPAPAIAEPRLSSTYDAAGHPTRVGLELWFVTEDSEEPEDDRDQQVLRRAAGEAIGDPAQWQVAQFTMSAVPVRWHSRGSDGTGVYLLGQRG